MTRDVIRSAETWLYIHIYTNNQPEVNAFNYPQTWHDRRSRDVSVGLSIS